MKRGALHIGSHRAGPPAALVASPSASLSDAREGKGQGHRGCLGFSTFALGLAPMRAATASAGRRRPSSKATTASLMGISTPSWRARCTTVRRCTHLGHVAERVHGLRQRLPLRQQQSHTPVARGSPGGGRTRSPRPDRPMKKVSARAPRARPRRVISARPRVMRAARALRPRCRPSHRPVAMASTF